MTGDGDRDLVEHADDASILRALDEIGDLSPEEGPLLGKFLAERLLEDAVEEEARNWVGLYRAQRQSESEPVDQDLAYEVTDPKHPGYLERLGV